jgi:hypothetical protein
MKKIYVSFAIVTAFSAAVVSTEARASAPCDKEAVSAAKDFAANDGDEACAEEEKTEIASVSEQRNKNELVYSINVDCGGGTSFTETVILLDPSCKVLNPQ